MWNSHLHTHTPCYICPLQNLKPPPLKCSEFSQERKGFGLVAIMFCLPMCVRVLMHCLPQSVCACVCVWVYVWVAWEGVYTGQAETCTSWAVNEKWLPSNHKGLLYQQRLNDKKPISFQAVRSTRYSKAPLHPTLLNTTFKSILQYLDSKILQYFLDNVTIFRYLSITTLWEHLPRFILFTFILNWEHKPSKQKNNIFKAKDLN